MKPKYKKGDILYTLHDIHQRPYKVIEVEVERHLFDVDYGSFTYETFITGIGKNNYWNVDESKLYPSKEVLVQSL